MIPLPKNEDLYRRACACSEDLDERNLNIWKQEPPFASDGDTSDPHSNEAIAFTHTLVIVLHGVRMREQKEMDAQRRLEFRETVGLSLWIG
jgi:hypothetical protein